MKTYEQWEKSKLDFDDFVKKGDEIDWYLYEHMVCGLCAPNYDDGTIAQCGEAQFGKKTKKGETLYYSTFKTENGKYYYIGYRADKNKGS